MSNLLSVTLFCPHCGQKLSLPTTDLQQHFRCPRCHAEASAAELIPPQKTLAAVPIESVRPPASVTPEGVPPAAIVHPVLQPPAAPAGPTPAPMGAPSWSPPWTLEPPAGSPSPVASPPAPVGSVEPAPLVLPEDFGRDERLLEGGRESGLLRAARFVLDLAERFDAFTYGYRLPILYVLSGIYCITAILTAVLGRFAGEGPALGVFFFVLLTYGLARLSMFRTEDGRWTWRTALQGLRGGWRRTWDWIKDYRELPAAEKTDTLASLATTGGCIAIAVRAGFVWALAPKGSIFFMAWAGLGWLAIAFGFYELYKTRSLRKGRPQLGPADQGGALVPATSGDLPAVIDLVRDSASELQRARGAYGAYLADLLEVLSTWNPRPRGDPPLEADYQASLHRHLRKHRPGLKIERERPIRSDIEGTRRRIDLAIDDCVVIEMKRSLKRTAEADRAFHQIRAYAKEWSDKGPVLLVLCETPPGFAQVLDLKGKMQELRANNYNVVAVAAGRRASA